MAPLPIRTLVEQSELLFGVQPYIASGALAERTGTMEPSEAQSLIEAWIGRDVPGPAGGSPAVVFLGNMRTPVMTVDDLPSADNNRGDVRLVLGDMTLHGWTGSAWTEVSSSGGGGGGGSAFPPIALPRPDAADYAAGTAAYDTDLKEPLWSDGVTWRDGRGVDVNVPPPDDPTWLSIRSTAAQRLSLSWAAPSGSVTTYVVKRGTVPGGPYTVVGSGVTITSFIDTGLTNGTTYYYVIIGVGPGGEGPASAEASGVPVGDTPPYDASSEWNTPIPGSPTLHTNSAAIVARIAAGGDTPPSPNHLTCDPDQFTIPVYEIDSTVVPLVPVTLSGGYHTFDVGDATSVGHGFPAGVQQFPIPAGIQLVSGDDSQMIILDRAAGIEYGLWQLQGGPGNWTATNAWRSHFVSPDVPGNTYSGWFKDGTAGRGGGSSYLAGLVRPWEIDAGQINHALAWGFNSPLGFGAAGGGMPLVPAPKSDGSGTHLDDPPEGLRVQLDPAYDLSTLPSTGLGTLVDAFQHVVADVLQRYGMFLIDHAGSTKIYVEARTTAQWDAAITREAVQKIPLASLRAIAPPGMSAPAAPTGVSATPGNGQVQVSWSAVADPNVYRYDILRATVTGGPYTKVGQTKGLPAGGASGTPRPATTFVDSTGIVNGTQYFYVVAAVNAAVVGPNSTQVSATPALLAPTAPTGVTATPGNAQVALAWNAVSGALTYTVKRATVTGGPYTPVQSGLSGTTFTDTGRTNGTQYFYVVSATNGVGEGPDSAQVSAVPQSKLFRGKIAQATQSSSALTLVATVTADSQTGDTVVVGVVGNNVSTTFDSVVDSKGNVYTAGPIVSGGNQGGRTQQFIAKNAAALVSTGTPDTITVTSSNARQAVMEAAAFAGVTNTDLSSTGTSGATSGTAVDSGATAVTAQPDIAVGTVGMASPLNTIASVGAGWTIIGSGVIAGNLKGLAMAYKIASATEAEQFAPTLTTPDGWHAIVNTLK